MGRAYFFASLVALLLNLTLFDSTLRAQEAPESTRASLALLGIHAENVEITTQDNLILKARLYTPNRVSASGVYPTVVFGNSWVLDHYEYEIPARTLAAKGYIVLNYTTRGFRGSQGTIGAGGPREVGDVSTILDWVLAHTQADVKNIALGGVSYGGGLALLGGAHDTRVKTTVSINAWGDIEQAMAGNETPHAAWMKVVKWTGEGTGTLDPEFKSAIDRLVSGGDLEAIRAWAKERSPVAYVDKINAREMPVFIANSYQDELFAPLQMKEFFEKLKGPKYFYMDKGVHAGSAIPGLFGRETDVWNRAYAWLDHYLVDETVPVTYGINFHSEKRDDTFAGFEALPTQHFDLRAVNEAPNLEFGAVSAPAVRINGNKDSVATSGKILFSELLTVYHDLPPLLFTPFINHRNAAVFTSEPLARDIALVSSPQLTFRLGNHATPVLVVAYLYDVDRFQKARLITYGAITKKTPSTQFEDVRLNLEMNGYEMEAGHKISVVLDTVDPLYLAPTQENYDLDIILDAAGGLGLDAPFIER